MISENYIRSLIVILLLALVGMSFPGNTTAITNPEPYENIKIPTPEELQIAAIDALSKELTSKAESLVGTRQGQCVVAIRQFFGVGRSEVQGWATHTRVNSQVPEVGSVIVFWGTKQNKYGHVGGVLFTTHDGWVYYYSPNAKGTRWEIANGRGRAVISKVKINSKTIKGYRRVPLSI